MIFGDSKKQRRTAAIVATLKAGSSLDSERRRSGVTAFRGREQTSLGLSLRGFVSL
jgi:hypothetical protein